MAPKKKVTPLPVAKVATIALINLMNTASYLMTMPMVPWMILHYFPSISEQEVGYYSGLLEGTFHVGAFFGAIFWGWFADEYGRRPALLLGLLGTIISAVWFGLSNAFWMAVLARFLWGALNGNVGTAKTALSELCDDTNSAKAFSFIGLNTGFGRVIGPLIGGLLSQPATKYPDIFGKYPLFVDFPFLLPCIVAAVMTGGCLLMTFFLLEETKHLSMAEAAAYKQQADAHTAGTAASAGRGRKVVKGKAAEKVQVMRPTSVQEKSEYTPGNKQDELQVQVSESGEEGGSNTDEEVELLLQGEDEIDDAPLVEGTPSKSAAGKQGAQPSTVPVPGSLPGGKGQPPPSPATKESTLAGMRRLIADRPVAMACAIYSALGLTGLVSNELYPLYMLNDGVHGGFGWTSSQVGLSGFAAGPFLVIFQAFVYDKLVQWLGIIAVMRYSLALFSVLLAATPLQSITVGWGQPHQDLVLYTHAIFINVTRVTAFICVFVVVANSALPEDRGRVNGLGQAAVSLVRALGPPLGTAAFAASVSPTATALGWPFNYHACWYGLAALSIGTLALTYELPAWISGKRPPSAR